MTSQTPQPDRNTENTEPLGAGADLFTLAIRESRTFLGGDPWERGDAADRLGRMASFDGQVLNYLIELAGSPEALVRSCAARALAAPAECNLDAQRQLVFLLDDPEPWVAGRAAWALVSVICSRCGVAIPGDEAELQSLLPTLSYSSVNSHCERMEQALKCARLNHSPVVQMVAEAMSPKEIAPAQIVRGDCE